MQKGCRAFDIEQNPRRLSSCLFSHTAFFVNVVIAVHVVNATAFSWQAKQCSSERQKSVNGKSFLLMARK